MPQLLHYVPLFMRGCIDRYQSKYGWQLISIKWARNISSSDEPNFTICFPDGKAISYPQTASFILYIEKRHRKPEAIRDAQTQYSKTFIDSFEWALSTGYLELDDINTVQVKTTPRVRAEYLYLRAIAMPKYYDRKTCGDNNPNLINNEIHHIADIVDRWLTTNRQGQEWLKSHGRPMWLKNAFK